MFLYHYTDEIYDDICYDKLNGETFVRVCQDCNKTLNLQGISEVEIPNLICSVRNCQNEVYFYADIEAVSV